MKEGFLIIPLSNFYTMRILAVILVLFLSSAKVFAQQNKVEINGWTNVNTFKCTNTAFKSTSSLYSFTGNQLPNVNLSVEDFDCRNNIMTSDFRKTLNYKQYPSLSIKFLEFKKSSNTRFLALVEVKMMNVSKKYTIEFSEYKKSLVGNKRLRFSDFNIVPPKKMGGMIYVKDELDLNFSLMIN